MDKIHPQLGKGLDRGAEPAQWAKGALIPNCFSKPQEFILIKGLFVL
jgi:hypothetical protein